MPAAAEHSTARAPVQAAGAAQRGRVQPVDAAGAEERRPGGPGGIAARVDALGGAAGAAIAAVAGLPRVGAQAPERAGVELRTGCSQLLPPRSSSEAHGLHQNKDCPVDAVRKTMEQRREAAA